MSTQFEAFFSNTIELITSSDAKAIAEVGLTKASPTWTSPTNCATW